MRYYTRKRDETEIRGPFTVDELASQLEAGLLTADHTVTSDLGESIEQVSKQRESDFFPIARVQGLERLFPPPAPPAPTGQSSVYRNYNDFLGGGWALGQSLVHRKSKTIAWILLGVGGLFAAVLLAFPSLRDQLLHRNKFETIVIFGENDRVTLDGRATWRMGADGKFHPDFWGRPGRIVYLFRKDTILPKGKNGDNITAQSGSAYVLNEQNDLVKIGTFDIRKSDVELSKDYGIEVEAKE